MLSPPPGEPEPEAEADANPNKAKKAPTSRKSTKSKNTIVKDKVIELGSGDLQKARDAYSDEMKKLNDIKKTEKDSVLQAKMARMCIFQVPLQVHAPELRNCELFVFVR